MCVCLLLGMQLPPTCIHVKSINGTSVCTRAYACVLMCVCVRVLTCVGKPRHVQDSRVMHTSLAGEDAVPSINAAEAKMHMHVLDKMLAKRKTLREVFVRMRRDGEGRVRVGDMRAE